MYNPSTPQFPQGFLVVERCFFCCLYNNTVTPAFYAHHKTKLWSLQCICHACHNSLSHMRRPVVRASYFRRMGLPYPVLGTKAS